MYTESQRQDAACQAAERFARRVPGHQAGEAPRPSNSQLFLARTQAKERTRALVAEASATGAGDNPLDTIQSLSQERVIGTPDLLDLNYMEFAIAVARGVARVHLADGFGTGSLVGPRILLTNHHVIGSEDEARGAVAEFDYQDNTDGIRLQVQMFAFDPVSFFFTDEALDVTLVAVAEMSKLGVPAANYPWSKLIAIPGKTTAGMPINIIQHPKGGLKQIAFRNNKVIEIPNGKPDFLYYTTDTEPGSSGSPCYTDGWDLVALHHSGVPRIENGKILKKDGSEWRQGDSEDTVDWIANEGTRISATVAALRDVVLPGVQADLLAEMLSAAPPNPIEVARRSARPDRTLAQAGGEAARTGMRVQPGARTAVWNIPLTLQISIGEATLADTSAPVVRVEPPVPAAAPAKTPVAAEEALKVDPDWSDREGYDPEFLGWDEAIPLPQLSAEQQQDSVDVPEPYRREKDETFVLNYHHYSLAMCKSRKMAWYSAANVDGDHRPKLPKRSGDKWNIDPRIEDDPEHPVNQLGEELYAADNTDRGHLTRYLDLAWGDSADEALAAMADTFHFTNCTLQLSNFNQSKDRWQGLEQYLLEQHARKEQRKIVVITGPLLRVGDPWYRNPAMSMRVRIPVAFWKVCVIVRQDGTLAATAFVMDQNDITELPGFEERFDVMAVQRTVAELEQETGFDFGFLRDHDPMAQGGAPGTLEIQRERFGRVRRKPILHPSDIVIASPAR